MDQMHYAPTRRNPEWDRWSVTFADGGSAGGPRPAPARRAWQLDPDMSHLGPDAASLGPGRLAGALAGSSGRR